MENLFNKIEWSTLDKLGKNRLLRSSYFWIVFIPIVTKFLSKIHYTTIKLPFYNQVLELTFDLPFSWQMFFVSAVFASTGNVIYTVFCPEFIKKYASFAEFKDDGQTRNTMKDHFQILIKKFDKNQRLKHLDKFCVEYIPGGWELVEENKEFHDKDREAQLYELNKLLSENSIYENKIADAFWYIHNLANFELKSVWKIVAALIFTISIGLITMVIFQNIFYTIHYMLTV